MTTVIIDITRVQACSKPTLHASLLKFSFLLFIFTNITLFYYWYDRNEPQCVQDGICRINPKLRSLLREKWGQTLYFNVLFENFKKIGNEWRLTSRLNHSTDEMSAELNCSALRQIHDFKYIAAGWTKSTYQVSIRKMIFSMKTVNIDGNDISSCMLEEDRFLHDCFLIAASKLLREITTLRSISHPNIVKILGYCVPVEPEIDNPYQTVAIFEEYGEPINVIKLLQLSWEDRLRILGYCVPVEPEIDNPYQTVAIFEEYGEPINVIKLLQLSWEDRLRISLGLSRLLKHLASFQEPISLNDFRRQQFIVIDGEPKLIDVDDVGLQEPKCNNTPCCFVASSTSNNSICVPCMDNVCRGYNEKLNIIKTGGHFIKHILPHGAPLNLNHVALRITAAFELASWNSESILKEMEDLATLYKSGLYRSSSSGFLSGFKEYKQKDVSNEFDYRCQLTASGYGCIVSVHDTEEAAEICLSDAECKAFVITDITTWTGRRIVHLKNGIGKFIDNNATSLYVRK